MNAQGVGNVSHARRLVGRNGAELNVPFRPALAEGRVMHIGQAVALVVASSSALAQDAADYVEIEYEPLKAVVGVQQAIEPGAATLWEKASSNIAIDWPGVSENRQNEAEVERTIATAPHVASIALVNQRLVVSSMEPRGASAHFDPATQIYHCFGSQGTAAMREEVAANLRVPVEKVIVITEDVGGAFGMKTPLYPEYISLLVAAKTLQTPVHWMSSRTESL